MKRLLSILLAFSLLAAQAIPAFAENNLSQNESRKNLDPSATYMKQQREPKAMPSIGSVRLPVILVDFDGYRIEDEKGFLEKCEEYFNAEYDPALAKESPFAQAVRGAYQKLSYGRLDLTGDILPIYHSEYPANHFKSRSDGTNLVVEILKSYVETGVLKKEDYDSDQDGLVDGVIVRFYVTSELTPEGTSVNQGGVFGNHVSSIGRLEGFSSCSTTVMFEKDPWSQEAVDIWGAEERRTECHEIGHMMGLPDHYPTSSYTWIDYSLSEYMGGGDCYLNIYDKVLLGWVDPVILTNENEVTEMELYAAEDYSGMEQTKAVVLIPDPLMFPFDEYYIVEYRNGSQKSIYTSSFYSELMYNNSGIVIWHCNTANGGPYTVYKDETRYVYPVYKSGRTRPEKYERFNYDSSDLYTVGDIFSSDSTPVNSDFYDDIHTGAYLKVESITPEKAVIKAGFRDPDIVPIPELEIVQSHTAIRKGTSLEVAITAKCSGEIIPGSPDSMRNFVISHNNVPKIIANGTFNESFLRLKGMRRTSESLFLIIPGRAYSDSLTGDGTFRYIIPNGVISYHNMYSREVISDIVYVDNTPPEIELQGPSPQIIECGESYTELGAVVTDNLDPDIKAGKLDGKLEIDASQVNTAKCGTYTVTYTATDHAGNETTVEREVIVQDTIAPTATVSYSTTQPTNGDVVAAITPSESVTVTNTENGSLSYTFTENGSFTFEFEDEAGNKGTAVATVSNIDKSLPTGTMSYDITDPTNQDVTATLTVPSGTTILNNGGSNTHVFAENGSFEFEIQNAAGTKGTVAASVTWIDKEAPTATITYSPHKLTNQDVIAAITPSEEVTVTSDGGLSHTFPENGSFTFKFEDEAGNKGSAIATVDWIDKEPPVITLLGENPLTIKLGEVYEEPGAEVADNQDTEIQSKLEIDASELDTETAGTYTVRYSATDKAGNLTEITRTVKVEKPEEPTPPTPPNPPIFIPPDPPVVELPFTDVSESSWYYEAVKFMYEQGLMAGTGETTFSPNTATTRGMIAAILYRLEGNPETDASMSFTDIGPGEYYSEAIAWAAEQGIVAGYSETLFGPDDPVTREQLVSMLYRYAGSPKTTENLEAFTDSKKASKYAKPALCWAVETGILSGKGNGILDPQGKATRAEVASVLMRYCEKIG